MHLRPDAALAGLPGPAGERYRELFRQAGLSIEVYAPRGHDPQQPHDRDEIYVVIAGHGEFLNGRARARFAPGDCLYVPAWQTHRFEHFSEDFATWVFFVGPPLAPPR